jgi:hypothetical protein
MFIGLYVVIYFITERFLCSKMSKQILAWIEVSNLASLLIIIAIFSSGKRYMARIVDRESNLQ